MLTICSTRLSVNKLLDTKDTSANYVESTVPLENTYKLYDLCWVNIYNYHRQKSIHG